MRSRKIGIVFIILVVGMAWFLTTSPPEPSPDAASLPTTSLASPIESSPQSPPALKKNPAPSAPPEETPSTSVLQREYSTKELGLLAMLERRQIDPRYGGMTLKMIREGLRDAELATWVKKEIPDERLARMHIIRWCVDNGYITAAPALPKKSTKSQNPIRRIKKTEQ